MAVILLDELSVFSHTSPTTVYEIGSSFFEKKKKKEKKDQKFSPTYF